MRELLEETGIKDVDIKTEVTFKEKYDFEKEGIFYTKIVTYYPGFISEMTKGTQLDQIDELKWLKILLYIRPPLMLSTNYLSG